MIEEIVKPLPAAILINPIIDVVIEIDFFVLGTDGDDRIVIDTSDINIGID